MIPIEKVKCKHCGQVLLKVDFVKGEIKCPRCKRINKIEVDTKGRVQVSTIIE